MDNQLNSKIKVILTGATGMVGEGVLNECLQHPLVSEVLVVNRRSCGMNHPKLKEILHTDYYDISPIKNELANYNVCFFCLGVSSVGMKEQEYFLKTYTLTMHFAETLSSINPAMTFCYISGAGTDSSEKGRIMWARVKGKTENDLMNLPFKQVYNFRPGILEPTKGLKNTLSFYKYLGWLIPIVRKIAPNSICSLKQLGIAMINAATWGYEKHILTVKDILELSKK